MEKRDIIPKSLIRAIVYTTNNLKIEGRVFKIPDIRLSDELNMTGKKYLFLKDAAIQVVGTETTVNHNTVFINKDQIAVVIPLE